MDDQRHYRERHLDKSQWDNMSASQATWYGYNSAHEARAERHRATDEIMSVIKSIICSKLTSRQREVLTLYFQERNTQVAIAKKLHISQPTVSQHLGGKKRHGKKIGGALRRIRKAIRRQTSLTEGQSERLNLLIILDSLLDDGITRRRASELLRGLS